MSPVLGDWSETKAKSRRDAGHPVVVDHVQRRIGWVLKNIQVDKVKTCLEIGSGDGFFSMNLMKHFDLTVSDSSPAMLKKNPFAGRKEVIDAREIAHPDGSFDLVFEANILHHIEEDRQVAKEMVRISSKYIVVLEPNRWNPLNFLLGIVKAEEKKSLQFSKNYVRELFEDLNVELVDAVSFGIIPANKCPVAVWRVLKFFDQVIPFLGLENIFVFRKKLNHD